MNTGQVAVVTAPAAMTAAATFVRPVYAGIVALTVSAAHTLSFTFIPGVLVVVEAAEVFAPGVEEGQGIPT